MPKQVVIQEARSDWSNPQDIHFRVTSFTRQWSSRPHLWRPPTDLVENEKALVVRMEVAGMQDAELNIAIDGNQLAIYGVRTPPNESCAYHQMEVRYGDFLSVLELPQAVDTEGIQADYKDGFLLVTLPKRNS